MAMINLSRLDDLIDLRAPSHTSASTQSVPVTVCLVGVMGSTRTGSTHFFVVWIGVE